MTMLRTAAAVTLITSGLLAEPANAEVTRFEIAAVDRPALQGRVFGERGTAEKITARATIALDPADPHNAVIADLALAPRNAEGRVEAVADVVLLRPERPNGLLLVEIPNRGRKLIEPLFEGVSTEASGRLEQAGDAGRGFLLSRGYTLAWIGWQGDIALGTGMSIRLPVLSGVTGTSREEWVFDITKSPASYISTRGDFLMLDDAWQGATAGLDPRAAADALAEAGFLRKGASSERKRSERVGGVTTRVWVVRRDLLSAAN